MPASEPDRPPPLIGLTGGLGAGKSTALAALRELGAAVVSADDVVHQLYDDDEVVSAVVGRWGSQVVGDDGVDRWAIAERAFADPEERSWLEGLLWPRVGRRVASWAEGERARRPPPRALVVETPLLFEAGTQDSYDATIAVISDEEIRRERAAGRGHALPDERAARQLPQDEKARRATFVVRNDGSVEQLGLQLSSVLEKLGA